MDVYALSASLWSCPRFPSLCVPGKKVFPDPPGKTWCKHVIRVPPRAVDNPIGNPTKFGIEFRNPIAGLNSDSHSHNYGSSSAKGEELVFA